MTRYEHVQSELRQRPRTWLVTGVAGFIGSQLLESLLQLDQHVTGLDNLSTGHHRNLDEVRDLVRPEQWARFHFIEGDIRDIDTCRRALSPPASAGASGNESVDCVLHQAALGSVPRSLADPLTTHQANINGFLNMLVAARDAGVRRFVYAASSSTYGDHPDLPKIEDRIGRPLSPYAVTKLVNELYADVFARCYGLSAIGLRYFNVFGQRQDPDGPYAAVIPKWASAMIRGETVSINGDGETSRDFCFIDNVVQANLLAATTTDPDAANQIYNVAVGERTSLNELFQALRQSLATRGVRYDLAPAHRDFQQGDVRHSQADVSKAQRLLGYAPEFNVQSGLDRAMSWYLHHLSPTP